jgi:hypothetical protein
MAQLSTKMDQYEQAIDSKLNIIQSQYSTLDQKIHASEQQFAAMTTNATN